MKIKLPLWNLAAWSFATFVGGWCMAAGVYTDRPACTIAGLGCIALNCVQFIKAKVVK